MTGVMNLTQLASYLNMSQASLYHLVAAGKIPGTKVGKQWRFSKSSVDEWLQGRTKRCVDILVVDDDPMILKTLVRVLQEAGHHCVGADSVARALTLLSEIEFDLLFLDLLLPDGTGLDVVAAALKVSRHPEIIMITAHPDDELIQKIQDMLPYITVLNKPVKLQALLELAARVVTR